MKKCIVVSFMILTMFSSLRMANALKIDFSVDPNPAFIGEAVTYVLEATLDEAILNDKIDSFSIIGYMIDFEGDKIFDIKSREPIKTEHVFDFAGIFTSVGRVIVTKTSNGLETFNSREDSFFDVFTEIEIIDPGAPVPEPATMFLLCTGLIGLAGIGRKKFFKRQ